MQSERKHHMNPLFADDEEKRHSPAQGYLLPDGRSRIIASGGANPAADLIRRKIDALYDTTPDAKKELAEATASAHRSKHQAYMHRLSTSGRSLAEIQTAWHAYYEGLNNTEKHEVWQEFYAANHPEARPGAEQLPVVPETSQTRAHVVVAPEAEPAVRPPKKTDTIRSVAAIKKQVLRKVRIQTAVQIKAKQHLQSMAVGIGLGALVLVILLFGLFNEIIIAPFIRPASNHAQATPIILNTEGLAPSGTPEVIIPKINVQIPVLYGSGSVKEEDIQTALNDGIFHYPTTALPGQRGNAAYFGHSSNNILNKGKYKFAFVLLHELQPGDIFYLTRDQRVYTYRIYEKRVVEPTETWVLQPVDGKPATAALITCDPPGTSLRRLVVWGEQISPDPTGNTAAVQPAEALQTTPLPGNGPSAWTKTWRFLNPFD